MSRVLVLAGFQVLTLLSWAGYHERVWATAPTFVIPLRPRDPYDLVRGRYFVLNPEDAVIQEGSPWLLAGEVGRLLEHGHFSGPVLVGFCPVEQVFRVCALRRLGEGESGGPARYWSRGFVEAFWPAEPVPGVRRTVRVDLGLSRFFIPNRVRLPAREDAPGWQLEVSHRPGLEPLPKRLLFRGTAVELN